MSINDYTGYFLDFVGLARLVERLKNLFVDKTTFQEDIQEVSQTATNANNTANTASTKANTAATKADTAASKADSAANTASEASAIASKALDSADKRVSKSGDTMTGNLTINGNLSVSGYVRGKSTNLDTYVPPVTVSTVKGSAQNIEAGKTKSWTIDATKAGYKLIGIIGFEWDTNREYFVLCRALKLSNNVHIIVRSMAGSSTLSCTPTIYCLYTVETW